MKKSMLAILASVGAIGVAVAGIEAPVKQVWSQEISVTSTNAVTLANNSSAVWTFGTALSPSNQAVTVTYVTKGGHEFTLGSVSGATYTPSITNPPPITPGASLKFSTAGTEAYPVVIIYGASR